MYIHLLFCSLIKIFISYIILSYFDIFKPLILKIQGNLLELCQVLNNYLKLLSFRLILILTIKYLRLMDMVEQILQEDYMKMRIVN